MTLPATPPPKPRTWLVLAALLAMAAAFFAAGANRRAEWLAEPGDVAALTDGDALHYVEIATAFAAGDLRMDWVVRRGHRQPLYPAALAVGGALVGREPTALTWINLALTSAAVLAAGLACWWLFASRLAAIAAAALLATDPFLLRESQHLLTEPLFVLCVLAALALLLRALRSGGTATALAAASAFGLAYLTRPNGLFLFAAALAVLALDLTLRWLAVRDRPSLRRVFWVPAAAVATFLVVATPSWLPRLVYKGQPFYHAYLSNFLWVDRYETASVPGDARYSLADYLASHTWRDAGQRMVHGWRTVLLDVPVVEFGLVASLLMVLGLALALLARRRDLWLLTLLFALQMAPIAWTQLSNPTTRIPAATTLPFGVFYVAFAGRCVGRAFAALTASRNRPRSAPAR